MPILTRNITVDVDQDDPDTLVVRAVMKDHRHDIALHYWVSLPSFAIGRATLEMCDTPLPQCRELCPAAQQLVGIKVQRGFNRKIRELYAGERGCVNLVHLLTVSAPLAINAARFVLRHPKVVTGEGPDPLQGMCFAYSKKG